MGTKQTSKDQVGGINSYFDCIIAVIEHSKECYTQSFLFLGSLSYDDTYRLAQDGYIVTETKQEGQYKVSWG